MVSLSKIVRIIYRNRSLRFTKEGISFVLFTLAVGIAAVNTGNNLLYLILAMMLSLIIVSGVLSEQCLKHLTIVRRFPTHLFAGSSSSFQVRITNHHRLFPSFSIQVQEQAEMAPQSREVYFLKLPASASQTRACSVTPARRGRYSFEKVAFLTRFPFGLFQKSLIRIFPDEVLVYPAIYSVQNLIEAGLLTTGTAQELNRRGTGATLHNLRDYQEGDDARNIHWKTSARQARLFIKEYEQEEEKRIRLVLDQELPTIPSGEPSADLLQDFEYAVSLTASLSAYFLNGGYWVELQTESCTVPFGIGQAHLDRILRPLALIRPPAALSGSDRPTVFRPEQSGKQAPDAGAQDTGPTALPGSREQRLSSDSSILIQAWESPIRQSQAWTFIEVLTIPKIKAVWPGPLREMQEDR
jgi:uncharacterized protein (DUF58 family)